MGAEQPPPPTSKGPASPLPHRGLLPDLQHLPLSPAWPHSHLPPSPRPWFSGRVARVPEDPDHLPASEPSCSGQTRLASDAPRRGPQHERGPRPQAGRSMATPLPFIGPAHASGSNSAPTTRAHRGKQERAKQISFHFRCLASSRFRSLDGLERSRERRERAQGLKHGGRRGPGECLLRSSLPSGFPAWLCVPGRLSPRSPIMPTLSGSHGLRP